MLNFQVERWWALKSEIAPLLAQHYEEMPFDLPLSLDEATYDRIADADRLHILTARAWCKESSRFKLVGYFVALLARHLHYDILTAGMDVFYLSPEYRKGRNGLLLFREFEESLRKRGVRFALATARLERNPGARELFKRLGWTEARVVYQKRIGD